MPLLAIDLGGTKLAVALFSEEGKLFQKQQVALEGRTGKEVGALLTAQVKQYLHAADALTAIGVAVPGIYYQSKGTVWAPNIPGWEEYPLLDEITSIAGNVPVTIDSDRACYILGELWCGNAKGCRDAIFLSVGTGIGAGIIAGGNILRGARDISGAIGWMALKPPFRDEYVGCGCFEQHASGEGIAKLARIKINSGTGSSLLHIKKPEQLTAHDVFEAYEKNDAIAKEVINECIQMWGMAVANLVSLLNPEKIIIGGGIFGPAKKLIGAIREEASKWAQPISMQLVKIEPSLLDGDAGLYGAGYLALQSTSPKIVPDAL